MGEAMDTQRRRGLRQPPVAGSALVIQADRTQPARALRNPRSQAAGIILARHAQPRLPTPALATKLRSSGRISPASAAGAQATAHRIRAHLPRHTIAPRHRLLTAAEVAASTAAVNIPLLAVIAAAKPRNPQSLNRSGLPDTGRSGFFVPSMEMKECCHGYVEQIGVKFSKSVQACHHSSTEVYFRHLRDGRGTHRPARSLKPGVAWCSTLRWASHCEARPLADGSGAVVANLGRGVEASAGSCEGVAQHREGEFWKVMECYRVLSGLYESKAHGSSI